MGRDGLRLSTENVQYLWMESVCGWRVFVDIYTPAGYVIEGNTMECAAQVSKPKRRSGLMV